MINLLVKQVFNNNVLLVEDKNDQEAIIWGRGIGFRAHSGQNYSVKKTDKIFSQISKNDDQWLQAFKKLPAEIPGEYFELAERIIQLAHHNVDASLDNRLLAPLTDHMYFAVKRFKMGLKLTNPMLFDIKRFFPQEYSVAKQARTWLEELSQVPMTDDESGFIAIHLVEHEMKSSNSLITSFPKFMEISKAINQIIQQVLGTAISEDSLAMTRLMTHVRFLLLRSKTQELDKSIAEDTKLLYSLMKHHYAAVRCMDEIIKYLETQIPYRFRDADCLYLLIHLIHITE